METTTIDIGINLLKWVSEKLKYKFSTKMIKKSAKSELLQFIANL